MMPDVPRVLHDNFDRHTPFEVEHAMETYPAMAAAVAGAHKEYTAHVLRPRGRQHLRDEDDCRRQDRAVQIVCTVGDRPRGETRFARRPTVEPAVIK